MTLWLTLALNSIALGGLLFLLSAGFSLIFGLMRIPNLMHGSFFMLGAYFGVTLLDKRVGLNFWLAALLSGLLAPLAFVSPRIIAAIVDGSAPADLTVTGLARALAYSWAEQEQAIGLLQ
jgi:branched-subunit amino acid ABC-type transport system permease component